MGSNPVNLAIRFLLELSALAAVGFWGWNQSDSWIRFVLCIGIPMIVGVVWGIFTVPDDPSRSGSALVAIPGILRLALELGIFAIAICALYNLEWITLSWVFGMLVILHYILSCDRILWLISK